MIFTGEIMKAKGMEFDQLLQVEINYLDGWLSNSKERHNIQAKCNMARLHKLILIVWLGLVASYMNQQASTSFMKFTMPMKPAWFISKILFFVSPLYYQIHMT